MSSRIFVISLIFVCTAVAWWFLGGTVTVRTENQDSFLKKGVAQLWGSAHHQSAPTFSYEIKEKYEDIVIKEGVSIPVTRFRTTVHQVVMDKGKVDVDLQLEHRKKGLQWYSTYKVIFVGNYYLTNRSDSEREYQFNYSFPSHGGIYDSFVVSVNGKPSELLTQEKGRVIETLLLQPGESGTVRVSYSSQGLDEWWYVFGSGVSQIRDFNLSMTTDFDDINFPSNGMSPTHKIKTENGWRLEWKYANLLSGIQIGMELPQKLNPGPFVARVSFFAPVSLFLFFFLLFIITTMRDIKLHPMNYFFVAASFFSFHLLMAYLVDHINIHLSFVICSVVSILLLTSYMRLVVGLKFALLETGIAQFVYLVLFSYAFFLEGYTGLAITVCCIVTLFVVMQLTGRMDWEKKFEQFGTWQSSPLPPAKT